MVSFGEIFALYEGFGYLGILLISFIGSIIVFIPVPYFPVLVTATLNRNFDPHLIALSSAVGAVAGKMIIFYGSYYGRNILSNTTKKRILPLQKLLSKYGWAGAFVASVTPIPDDLVYIPLGLAKYSPWKFATAVFSGKLILNEMIVAGTIFIGRPFVDILSSEEVNPVYLATGAVVSAAVLGLLIYFSLRIDWSKIIGKWFPWTLSDNDIDKEKKRLRATVEYKASINLIASEYEFNIQTSETIIIYRGQWPTRILIRKRHNATDVNESKCLAHLLSTRQSFWSGYCGLNN